MNSQNKKTDGMQSLADFVNNTLIDFNQLTTALKGSSKTVAQMNHHLKNKLLLANQIDSKVVVKDVLNHLLRVSQIKGVQNIVISILYKVIVYVKILEKQQTKQSLLQRNQEMGQILSSIIDIVVLLKNHSKQIDIILRIIQATFSLIDEKMLQFANYNNLVRLYSVCFECCQSNANIQNISVSALFSLTQIIFSSKNNKDSFLILTQMLQYLFQSKKFLWIKDKQLNGMIWDLVNVAIKALPTERLSQLFENRQILNLLVKMYNLSAEKAFVENEDFQKSVSLNKSFSKEQYDRNINFKKGYFPDFIRFYKTFIYFTIYLYFRSHKQYRELIPFRNNFLMFKSLYQTARNSKLYLLLEGASLILSQNSYFLIEQQQGVILIDVFNKVCEQLDKSQRPLEFCTDKRDLYLDRLCGDFNKINDNYFVKIIKNTILRLRRNLQNQSHKFQQKIIMEQKSLSNQMDQQEKRSTVSLKKRWERLIKIVLKIIKHLTSLNLIEGSNQQIVRKLIGELQYWFIISPTRKLKNLILQQIFLTSTFLDTRIQSIKASQCLQIGSNIIYGYYDTLDTFGLAVIIRMIAGIQISWQQGKGFDQLEEVCIMTEKLYTEQQLVHSPQSFIKTVHAFAQCLTGLLADFEHPIKNDSKQSKNYHKKHVERYHKMINYILAKIQSILQLNSQYIQSQWDFLTGLWISSASNKNSEIRHKVLNHLLSVIIFIIKKTSIDQQTIIILYQQLAKLSLIDISKTIVNHLKHILLNISSEDAILQLFKTLSVILQTKGSQTMHQQLFQFVEMIIKQSLFQVKSVQKLIKIIDQISFISKDKSQQYKVVNLIWNISDHLKTLKQNHEDTQNKEAWMHLFNKIIYLAEITENAETKQSCIHAFTQIIAESIRIMGKELFLSILNKEYIEIFSILMSFEKTKNEKSIDQQSHINQGESLQNQKGQSPPQIKTLNIDMIRIGIKNFIKITRKCLSINILVSKAMFLEAFQRIHRQLNEKKTNTIEYLIQINVFLQYFQEILHAQQYQNLNLNENVIKILQDIQKNHEIVDKSTFTWKKYNTAFEEIKVSFLPK